jgi:hypothetical protein
MITNLNDFRKNKKINEDFGFLPDQSLIKVGDDVQFISRPHIIDRAIPGMGAQLVDKIGKVVEIHDQNGNLFFDIKVEGIDTIIGVPDTIIDKY